MRVFLSLATLYIRSFYNLPGKRATGSKPELKSALKSAGIALLAIIVVADIGFVFVFTNLAMYDALMPMGLQGLIVLNAAVIATVMTLVIGFLTALSTYFLSDMELQLLSMPVQPKALFAAKFTAVYVSEAAFSLFFMAVTMVIFGIKENPHPLFYVWGTLAGLLLPLPVLAFSYFVQVPLLSFARFLRNKQAILLVGGVLGMLMAVGFNIYYQGTMSHMSDPEWIARNVAGPDSIVARMGRAYPPALFTWQALSAPAAPSSALSILALVLVCLAGPALAVLVLSKAYAASLIGFNEAHLKKLNAKDARDFIRARIKRSNAFRTMVKREFVMMNREPMYLLNGPFIIVLMPVIFAVMIVVQKDAFMADPDMAGIMTLLNGGAGALVAGLVGAFLGSSTSITCTSVSRDAKALPFIKSLPVSATGYLLAKLAHGLLFAAFGSAVGAGLIAYAVKLGPLDAAIGLLVALGLSSLLNLGGLWLDAAAPRLKWDNPMAALKQNPNSVIAILGSMGLMGGLGYLAFTLRMGRGQVALWLGVVPLAAFAGLLLLFSKYAERRMEALEA